MHEYRIHSVQRIIDGDTFEATIDLGFKVHIRMTVRLAGINAPELRTANETQRQRAIAATEWLRTTLASRSTWSIATSRPDSFGRTVATVYDTNDTYTLNEHMVLAGHAEKWTR